MAGTKLPEHWLRGPLPNIPPLLQPVAHALLQARDEVAELMQNFPEYLLWEKPAGVASVGFHLQHLTGVLDRLVTYAQGGQLSEAQLAALKKEGDATAAEGSAQDLVAVFNRQVDLTLKTLEGMQGQNLLEERLVGRAKLPSTVLGLLFHAAEHTMRHTGQLLVTAKVVQERAQ